MTSPFQIRLLQNYHTAQREISWLTASYFDVFKWFLHIRSFEMALLRAMSDLHASWYEGEDSSCLRLNFWWIFNGTLKVFTLTFYWFSRSAWNSWNKYVVHIWMTTDDNLISIWYLMSVWQANWFSLISPNVSLKKLLGKENEFLCSLLSFMK